MPSLILREFNSKKIRQRPDGFMSLTDMCRAGGKLFGNWNQLKTTQEYVELLAQKYYCDSNNTPIESSAGNLGESGGTWGDRRVALRLAQWISPEFALQVDEWIQELLTTGTVTILESNPSNGPTWTRELAPQRDLLDYWKAAQEMGIADDPIMKSLFTQRMAEQIGSGTVAVSGLPIVLTVRAQELGVSQKEIGTGSTLGTYIVAKGFVPEGKTQHGRYRVNTYKPSKALDTAIMSFFCSDLDVA